MEKEHCIGCNQVLRDLDGICSTLDFYCNNPSCARYGLISVLRNTREEDDKEKIKDA